MSMLMLSKRKWKRNLQNKRRGRRGKAFFSSNAFIYQNYRLILQSMQDGQSNLLLKMFLQITIHSQKYIYQKFYWPGIEN